MPSISIAGCCSETKTLRILLRIVSAKREPTRTAPLKSVTVAFRIACFIVSEGEETEVAKELAISTYVPRVKKREKYGNGEEAVTGSRDPRGKELPEVEN